MDRQSWLDGTLYHPDFERDSCGFGLMAQMDDKPSHYLVQTAISSLACLTGVRWLPTANRRWLRAAVQAGCVLARGGRGGRFRLAKLYAATMFLNQDAQLAKPRATASKQKCKPGPHRLPASARYLST